MLPPNYFEENSKLYYAEKGGTINFSQKRLPNDLEYSPASRFGLNYNPVRTLSPMSSRRRTPQIDDLSSLVSPLRADNASLIFNDFMEFSTRLKEKSKELIVTDQTIEKINSSTPRSRTEVQTSAFKSPRSVPHQRMGDYQYTNAEDHLEHDARRADILDSTFQYKSGQFMRSPHINNIEATAYAGPNRMEIAFQQSPYGFQQDASNPRPANAGSYGKPNVFKMNSDRPQQEEVGFSAQIYLEFFETRGEKEDFLEKLYGKDSASLPTLFQRGKISFNESTNNFSFMTLVAPLVNVSLEMSEMNSAKFFIINKQENLICMTLDWAVKGHDENPENYRHLVLFTIMGNVYDFLENKLSEATNDHVTLVNYYNENLTKQL